MHTLLDDYDDDSLCTDVSPSLPIFSEGGGRLYTGYHHHNHHHLLLLLLPSFLFVVIEPLLKPLHLD